MDKRVVIFLVLSLAVILGFDFLLKQMGWLPEPPPAQDGAVSGPSSAEQKPTPAPVTSKDSGSTGVNVPIQSSHKSNAPSSDIPPATSEQTVTVETDLVRVGLSNRGGVIRSWELKRYHTAPPEKKPVQLVYQEGKFKGPLSITVANADIDKTIREGLYNIEKDFTSLDAAHPVGHVTMQFHDSVTHLGVEKRLTFHHDSYVVDVSVALEGVTDPYDVGLGTNFGIVEWGGGFIGVIGSASRVDDKIEKETPDKEKELERKGAVQWVALHDKYFLSVLMPKQGTAALAKNEGDKIVSAGVRMAASGVASSVALQLYAGPKEHDTLRSLNVGLEEMIDFGFFIFGSWTVVKSVAKPIFYVLRFIHDYAYNYGVTIILLTMAIKLLFVPLQYKSYKSMKMMRLIQPKIAAVQEKYKGDRDRLNKELMKLYKDQKVNPLGGFLPMILQMPVFVALFNVLYTTIDLRQAPFMLWITDLSVQDPYYVLPVIMGATMFIQQKITPTTMDPTQAKIMLVLPVGMTFLFVNFPAGLVLYWVTNNTLTISQQLITDRFMFRNKTLVSAEPERSGGTNA